MLKKNARELRMENFYFKLNTKERERETFVFIYPYVKSTNGGDRSTKEMEKSRRKYQQNINNNVHMRIF
jgi:hypothetical protein